MSAACNHIDISLALRIRNLQDTDIQSEQKLHIGNEGDPESMCNKSGNHLILVSFIYDFRFLTDLLEKKIGHVAETGTLIKINIRVCKCFTQWNSVLVCQRMSVRYDQDEILFHNRCIMKIVAFRRF